MSRLMLTSDLHLGHKGITKYRTQFSSSEEHDEVIFDNLLSSINKRDTLYLRGDICFTKEWLHRFRTEVPQYTKLILGNHDLERGITIQDVANSYNSVGSLLSKRNIWFSHCPIHPKELRGRTHNIHGHLHNKVVERPVIEYGNCVGTEKDPRYINVCVEHTDWKPVAFKKLIEQHL